MKISTATILDSCFFENTERVSCGHRVAYLPDARLVASLDPDGDTDGRWALSSAEHRQGGYRLCQNDRFERICVARDLNWRLTMAFRNRTI